MRSLLRHSARIPRSLTRTLPSLVLAAALLGTAWPTINYEERERVQVASMIQQRDDKIAMLAGSLGDIPMSTAVVGGPIVGRPLLDMIRGIVEPQSSAAQAMMGVKQPGGVIGGGPGKPGGLYAVRKLLEGMVFAIMIPALLITLTMGMVTKQMSFRDAGLAALKPWSIAVLALLAYPLLDMVTYWGIGRPVAQQLGSYELKKGIMLGVLNSGVTETAFQEWANKQYNGKNENPEARRSNAAGGVATGMNLTMVCAKAISTSSGLDELFKATDGDTPYELRECRSKSVSVEAKLIMMRGIIGMIPVLEGESGDGANLLVDVGTLMRDSPEVIMQIFDDKPSKAAADAAVAASPSASQKWYAKVADNFKVGWNMVTNPARILGEMLQRSVAGVVAGVATALTTVLIFLLSVEAELARAFSLALAPIAIGWALFPAGGSKLFEWAKGHTAACFRVAGAELLGLILMTLVMGIMLFPLRYGGFGLLMLASSICFAIIMMFVATKAVMSAMAGDVTAGATTLAKGAMTGIGVMAAAGAAAAIGPAAGALGKTALGTKIAGQAVRVSGRAAGVARKYKEGAEMLGVTPNAKIVGGAEKTADSARKLFEASQKAARKESSDAVAADPTTEAVAAKNFRSRETATRIENSLRANRQLLGNSDLRVPGQASYTRTDGTTASVSSKAEALAKETRAGLLKEAQNNTELQKELREVMRYGTDTQREAATEMKALLGQTLMMVSAEQGGVRDAVNGRFSEDKSGNRIYTADEDSIKVLANGIAKAGIETDFREAAFRSGMLDALDKEKVSLDDILSKSAGASAALSLIADSDLKKKSDKIDRILTLKKQGVAEGSPLGAAMMTSEALRRGEKEDDEAYPDRAERSLLATERRIEAVLKAESEGKILSPTEIALAGSDMSITPNPKMRSKEIEDPELRAGVSRALLNIDAAMVEEAQFWSSARNADNYGIVATSGNGVMGFSLKAEKDSILASKLADEAGELGMIPQDITQLPESQKDEIYTKVWYLAASQALGEARRLGSETNDETIERLGLRTAGGSVVTSRIRELFSENPGAITSRIARAGPGGERAHVISMSDVVGARGSINTSSRREVAKLAEQAQQLMSAMRRKGTLAHIEGVNDLLDSFEPVLQEMLSEIAEDEEMDISTLLASLPDTLDLRGIADAEVSDAVAGLARTLSALEKSRLNPSHTSYEKIGALRKKLSEAV